MSKVHSSGYEWTNLQLNCFKSDTNYLCTYDLLFKVLILLRLQRWSWMFCCLFPCLRKKNQSPDSSWLRHLVNSVCVVWLCPLGLGYKYQKCDLYVVRSETLTLFKILFYDGIVDCCYFITKHKPETWGKTSSFKTPSCIQPTMCLFCPSVHRFVHMSISASQCRTTWNE